MKQLEAISKSMSLTKKIYEWCNKNLPEKEKFGLWSQMTRCAVSIPSNLAEGQQRGDKEFIRFVNIARGSLKELEIQFEIAKEMYTDGRMRGQQEYEIVDLMDEIGKMTYGLLLKLKADTEV